MTTTSNEEAASLEGTLNEEIRKLRSQIRELEDSLARREQVRDSMQELRAPAGRARSRPDARRPRASGGYRSSSATDRASSREYRSFDDAPRDPGDTVQDAMDVMRDLPARAMDEASKFFRGLTFAYLEQLRVGANVLNAFTGEVLSRNRPGDEGGEDEWDAKEADWGEGRARYADDAADTRGSSRPRVVRYTTGSARTTRDTPRRRGGRTVTGLAANLPRDTYAGVVTALDEVLSSPRRVVDRFYESYRESDEADSSVDRGFERDDTELDDRDRDVRFREVRYRDEEPTATERAAGAVEDVAGRVEREAAAVRGGAASADAEASRPSKP